MDAPDIHRRLALAADRTLYAAERTYAAWMRTGLTALVGSVGAKPLLTGALPDFGIRGVGAILAIVSAACFTAAVWREVFGIPHALAADARRIPPAVLFVVNTLLVLVSLTAFVAVVFG
jgi:putative membrane protein